MPFWFRTREPRSASLPPLRRHPVGSMALVFRAVPPAFRGVHNFCSARTALWMDDAAAVATAVMTGLEIALPFASKHTPQHSSFHSLCPHTRMHDSLFSVPPKAPPRSIRDSAEPRSIARTFASYQDPLKWHRRQAAHFSIVPTTLFLPPSSIPFSFSFICMRLVAFVCICFMLLKSSRTVSWHRIRFSFAQLPRNRLGISLLVPSTRRHSAPPPRLWADRRSAW